MLAFNTNKIFTATPNNFEAIALEIFHFQYQHNSLYNAYVKQLGVNINKIKKITEIPFLPIQFFKTHKIQTTAFESQQTFTSSGTTGKTTSSHFVKDVQVYETAFRNGFNQFYGNINNYCVLGLLPSYLERNGSSLVYMVNDLIQHSKHELSDFYLDELDHLYLLLQQSEIDQQPTLLIGVTFALLDFASKYKMNLKYTTILETGGMKGRGKELTRQQVHHIIQQQLGVNTVHSEYGMTELLSQAYSKGNGIFECTNTMQVYVRSEDDPLQVSKTGKGILNVIDLANVYSCSFIATDDVAQIYENNSFAIQGRLDNSDLRGCSLLTV